jgi:hypothetical protein
VNRSHISVKNSVARPRGCPKKAGLNSSSGFALSLFCVFFGARRYLVLE